MANYVSRIAGAIGYVEYAYAKQNKLPTAKLVNREGAAVSPSEESFKSAAAGADWSGTPGMAVLLTHQPGKSAWPITGASFILIHTTQQEPERAREVLKFFDWAYANGDRMAAELDYVPMPDSVVKLIKSTWTARIRDAGGKPVY